MGLSHQWGQVVFFMNNTAVLSEGMGDAHYICFHGNQTQLLLINLLNCFWSMSHFYFHQWEQMWWGAHRCVNLPLNVRLEGPPSQSGLQTWGCEWRWRERERRAGWLEKVGQKSSRPSRSRLMLSCRHQVCPDVRVLPVVIFLWRSDLGASRITWMERAFLSHNTNARKRAGRSFH